MTINKANKKENVIRLRSTRYFPTEVLKA